MADTPRTPQSPAETETPAADGAPPDAAPAPAPALALASTPDGAALRNVSPWNFTRRAFIITSGAAAALAACGPNAIADMDADAGTAPEAGTDAGMDAGMDAVDSAVPADTRDVANPEDGGTLGAARADSVYRIHPAIGIARLGNAPPATFFIGPEIPGQPPLGDAPGTAAPPYKSSGLIKPQAVRFRLFEYRRENGKLVPVREVTADTPGVERIEWTAHIANRKASFHKFNGLAGESSAPATLRNPGVTDRRSLDIDFGPRSISGRAEAPVWFRAGTSPDPSVETYPRKADGSPVIEYLGQLRTDDKGRLLVLGATGRAAYQPETKPDLPSYCNNDGWFDDASDGPVTARVVINEGGTSHTVPVDAAGGAWVLCTPPTFAPGILACTSMYDLLYDLGVRAIPIPADNAMYDAGGELARLRQLHEDFQSTGADEFPNTTVDFTDEIQPILQTGYNFRWVTNLAVGHHTTLLDPRLGDPASTTALARATLFSYMRPPTGATPPGGPQTMPRLLGSDPYTTAQPDNIRRQTLSRTQIGLMRRWSNGNFTAARTGGGTTPGITPHGLDRAALENGCGGAFYPGIEVGWQMRNPALFIEPFRLRLDGMSGYFGEATVPVRAGHFTRQMALPWHADFNDCQREGVNGWWPSARPDDVFLAATDTRPVPWARPDTSFPDGTDSSHIDMIDNWYKFGFVVRQGTRFLETERADSVP